MNGFGWGGGVVVKSGKRNEERWAVERKKNLNLGCIYITGGGGAESGSNHFKMEGGLRSPYVSSSRRDFFFICPSLHLPLSFLTLFILLHTSFLYSPG